MQRFSRLSVPEKSIAACSLLGAKKFQLLWQTFKTLRFSPGTPTLLLYCQYVILQMLGIKTLDLLKVNWSILWIQDLSYTSDWGILFWPVFILIFILKLLGVILSGFVLIKKKKKDKFPIVYSLIYLFCFDESSLFCYKQIVHFYFQPKERGSTRVHALNNVNRVLQVLHQNNVSIFFHNCFWYTL